MILASFLVFIVNVDLQGGSPIGHLGSPLLFINNGFVMGTREKNSFGGRIRPYVFSRSRKNVWLSHLKELATTKHLLKGVL